MPKELVDLTVEEISLVDEPANPGARMLIYKRVSKAEETPMETVTCKKCGYQMSKDATKCPECGTPVASETGAPSMSEEAKALATAQADLKAAEELVAEEQKKREAAEAEVAKLKLELTKSKMTPDAAEKEIAKLQADLKVARMSPEERKKAEREALPETIRKQLQDSEEQIAKLTDAAEVAEYEKRAGELKLKGIAPAKLGPVLKRVAKGQSTTEDLADIERLLRALNEQVKHSSLFSEIGKGGFDSGEPSAERKVMARVEELRKATPSVSVADAISTVLKADEALAGAYFAESRGQA